MKKLSSAQRGQFAKAMLGDLATLANMDFSFGPGRSLTAGRGGAAGLTAAFTPATVAKQPTPRRVTAQAGQTAGQLLPAQKADKVTPEQTFDQSLHPSPEPTAASTDVEANPPIKTDPVVSAARVQQYLLARFNPIRGLTPHLLSTYLEQSDLGFLRFMALVWNKIRERDDQIGAVAVKRELRPTDMAWEVVPIEDTPAAMEHAKALEDFYDHLVCTHALDQNMRGGVSLLVRLMQRAVGDKFSVFEMVWRPEPDLLTAEFRWIPVWFFENRTGQLRFLPYELALQGVPLDPGGWMVHVAEGLFQATSIAYLIKQMGLKYWASYAEKFGIPFLHGKTNAQYGSAEWEQFKSALAGVSSDGSILTNQAGELNALQVGSGANMPQPALVDRMDRAIARIWAGGDLSSMSRGGMGHSGGESGGGHGSAGAMGQQENEENIAKADAVRISETLQFYVDRWVIRYKFGEGVAPLAKFTLEPPRNVDADREIKVDSFLMQCGVPMAIHDLVERYGRAMPEEGEPMATPPPAKPAFGGGLPGEAAPFGNVADARFRRYQVTSTDLVARAQADAIAPVRNRLLDISKLEKPEDRAAALKKLREDLPRLLKRVAGSEALTKALEDAMGTALVIGATDSAQKNGGGRNGHGLKHAITR